MSNGWTAKRRARYAVLIRQRRPWEQSTGPKSAEGKARVARNAWKGGARVNLRALAQLLRELETSAEVSLKRLSPRHYR